MSDMVLHEAGLEFRSTDGEPRIRDLDLAERLGYERARNIRDLIRRWAADLGTCRTVRHVVKGNEVEEFWLTEAQALFVGARKRARP